MPKYSPFSTKQLAALKWWTPASPYRDYTALVCDGSIRAGKSLSMVIGFVTWAMSEFDGRFFALCGVSVGALRRNVVPLIWDHLNEYFSISENKAENFIDIEGADGKNRFYLFGGNDARSASAIQGMTLAGVLFDEVALMPRSFVEQAAGRCSVPRAKLWFNCNPEHPQHWFYKNWIAAEPKDAKRLHLHFTMDDNPSLPPEVRRRYMGMFTGTFFKRFILGQWVQAGGAVYPNFSEEIAGYHGQLAEGNLWGSERFIAMDFGVHNPTAMLDLYLVGSDVYQDGEYYYNSREETEEQRPQKTTGEYYEELVKLVESRKFHTMQGQYQVERVKEPTAIIIDPSASPMIAEIESHGRFIVIKADNEVLAGIRATASMIAEGKYHINLDRCSATVKEFYSYVWDEKAKGEDKPVKENDHAMDALRYFTQTIYVNERGLLYDGR